MKIAEAMGNTLTIYRAKTGCVQPTPRGPAAAHRVSVAFLGNCEFVQQLADIINEMYADEEAVEEPRE